MTRSLKLTDATRTPGPPPKASLSLNSKLGSPPKETSSFETHLKSAVQVRISSPQSLFCSREDDSPRVGAVGGLQLVDRETWKGHWVLAFGYTNDSESQELFSILKDYGRILSTKKSSGNWMAVQFQDEVSAVRASARQILRVGSILCGISRTNSQLLQELVSKQSAENFDLSAEPFLRNSLSPQKSSLGEDDILAGYANKESEISMARKIPKSICEKLFYWYFGWDTSKLHGE